MMIRLIETTARNLIDLNHPRMKVAIMVIKTRNHPRNHTLEALYLHAKHKKQGATQINRVNGVNKNPSKGLVSIKKIKSFYNI